MRTVQESKVRARAIWYSYINLILGGSFALGLNYICMFTMVHEFLHAVPLFLTGIPFFISDTFCTSPYILGLFKGVSWLSCVFPYLVGYIVTFAPVPYVILRRKLSLFWFEFTIVSFVLTLLCHAIHLWGEFIVIPI